MSFGLKACLMLLATGIALPAAAPRPADGKPNVLVCVADDLSWAHLGFQGDPAVRTPHLDRLAAEGVVFTHAFVSSSTCTPSRAAMLTGRDAWRLEDGAHLSGTLPARFDVYPSLLEKAGYVVGRSGKGYGPGKAAGWAEWDHDPAGPEVRSFQAFLRDRGKDRPFVFWFGSKNPHRPYAEAAGERGGIRPDKVRVLPYWPDTPEVRRDLADYLSEVQDFDAEVGAHIRALEEAGELDRTAVFVTSDNGMPFPRCKASLYDYGTRCPLIVRWPGVVRPGRTVDDIVGYTDLAPTFLEMARLTAPEGMTGKSLLPLLSAPGSGTIDASRDAAFFGTDGLASGRHWPARGVRTRHHLYIRNLEPEEWPVLGTLQGGRTKKAMDAASRDPEGSRLAGQAFGRRPAEELYDLKTDPFQLANLADAPAYAEARAEMAARLDRRLARE